TVRDWGLHSLELVRVFSGHTQPVTALALPPPGTLVWSGALDSTVRAWDLDRERLHSLVRLDTAVHAVALGQGGVVWAGHGTSITALRPFERRFPPHESPSARSVRTSSTAAASATVLAIGPFVDSWLIGREGLATRPLVALIPKSPQADD